MIGQTWADTPLEVVWLPEVFCNVPHHRRKKSGCAFNINLGKFTVVWNAGLFPDFAF